MKQFVFLIIFVVVVILYFYLQIVYARHLTDVIKEHTVIYKNESGDTKKTLLVLGDSTAVGLGAATTSDSIPALVAKKINATYTENYAISGSVVDSLPSQIRHMKRDHYNLIFIQIGANDIAGRHDVLEVSNTLEKRLFELSKKADHVVFLTAGNMGGVPAIPFFLHPYYKNLTLKYHSYFQNIADKLHVTYVNLYEDPSIDPFVTDSEHYFAKDGFHPSSLGYAHWFKKIEPKL